MVRKLLAKELYQSTEAGPHSRMGKNNAFGLSLLLIVFWLIPRETSVKYVN